MLHVQPSFYFIQFKDGRSCYCKDDPYNWIIKDKISYIGKIKIKSKLKFQKMKFVDIFKMTQIPIGLTVSTEIGDMFYNGINWVPIS